MVPCKLCSSLVDGDTNIFSTLDAQKSHAKVHLAQLSYISDGCDQIGLEQIFASCFPSDKFEKSEETMGVIKEIEKSRSSLLGICQNIIDRKKNQSDSSIKCQDCGTIVPTTNHDDDQDAYSLLMHVCLHSSKQPFVCRECDREAATELDIERHVGRVHGVISPVGDMDYDENWSNCFDEIKESVVQCFGGEMEDPQAAQSSKIQTPRDELSVQRRTVSFESSKSVRSSKKRRTIAPLASDSGSSSKTRPPPSELWEHRRSIYLDAMKNANAAKKIRCGQCKKVLDASRWRHLKQHVYAHLCRPIFECALCRKYWSTYDQREVKNHLAKEHGAPSVDSYVDHSDEFHEEIIDLAMKCFGKKEIE